MCIVGLRSTALVILLPGAERPIFQVLQLAAPPVVPDDDVELLVWSESQDSAVVVAELPRLVRRIRRLQGTELDDALEARLGMILPAVPQGSERFKGG
jgi:hypothetical protein